MKDEIYNLQLMVGNLSSEIMNDADKHKKELKRIINKIFEMDNNQYNKQIKQSLLDSDFIYHYGENYNQLKEVLEWFQDNTDIKWDGGENPTDIEDISHENNIMLYYDGKSLSYFITGDSEELKKHFTFCEYDDIWEINKPKQNKKDKLGVIDEMQVRDRNFGIQIQQELESCLKYNLLTRGDMNKIHSVLDEALTKMINEVLNRE